MYHSRNMDHITDKTIWRDRVCTDNLLGKLMKNDYDFETFKKNVLMNAGIVGYYSDILGCCGGTNISPRDFMMIYLFAFFDFGDELKEISLDIIHHIHAECTGPEYDAELGSKIILYENRYTSWKKNDEASVLQELTRVYWEFELICHLNERNFTPEESEAFTAEKNKKQDFILKRMRAIDDLEYFYSYVPVVLDDNIVARIHETLKKAYWDKVKQDLPNIETILNVLTEMRQKLEFLVPVNRRDLIVHFDEVIDLDFIKQLHSLGSTDTEFWTRKCHHLKDLLLELDSDVRNERHVLVWNELSQKINSETQEIRKVESCIDFLAYVAERIMELHILKTEFVASLGR